MKASLPVLTFLTLLTLSTHPLPAATVTGNLTDVSLAPLNTKLVFAPTNEVLMCSGGLRVGPANNSPNATFQLKLGSTVLVSVAKSATTANWHLRAAITLRSVGPAAVVIGSFALAQNNLTLEPFFFASQTATVDTTTPLTLTL